MNFISICSGIEAASAAFTAIGWKAIAFSEIDKFASAVLQHHYPNVKNFGDMTKFRDWPEDVFVNADAVVGGPPCQAFSVAGTRQGLNDERGNLTLIYVELLNHADAIRSKHGKPPVVALYENVPGIFSDKTNAFGCLVGGLAGEDAPAIPPGARWTNAGCVFGAQRAIAWRVLDAQFFGVAQRRRRVFVVASARPGFDPVQVLFEWDGVRRDSAPSRKAGQETAGTLASRTGAGGFPGTDEACSGYLQPVECFGGNRTSGPLDVSTALNASGTASGRQDFESETFVVHGSQDPDTLRDMAHTLGRNQGQENAVYAVRTAQTSSNGHGIAKEVTHTLDQAQGQAVCVPVLSVALRGRDGGATAELGDEVAGCLRASSGGGDKPHVLVPVAHVDIMPTLRSGGGSKASHGAVSGDTKDEYLVPMAFDTTQMTSAANRSSPKPGDPCHPLAAGVHAPAIAYTTKLHNTGSNNAGKIFEERTPCLDACSPAPALLTASQVRRLTPEECEKLQGFSPGYTAIPWRGKPADQCPDGPRYKALGNSWAVPVARWIGRRIHTQLLKLEAQHG